MIVTNLSKRFGKKHALNNVNFELDQRCTALLGPNGAGKTTLIKCIAGLIAPSEGFVNSSNNAKVKVGYLPQHFSFLPNLTVRESLVYLGILSKIDRKSLDDEVTSVVELASLSEYVDTRVKMLSGGTIRRLGIAQSLLGSPELLLLDEPTAGLDIEERGKLKSVLARAKKSSSLLISTHLAEDITGLCDRALVIKRGKLIYDGGVEGIADFANGRVFESKDEKVRLIGGIASGTSLTEAGIVYRYVMPDASSEFSIEPTIEDGYLALLHRDSANGKV